MRVGVASSPGKPVSASSPAIDSDFGCVVSTVPVVLHPLDGSDLLVFLLLASVFFLLVI